jgi:two-component system cell cycle response regulator DivK
MQGDDLAKPAAKVVLIVEDNELNRRLLHDVLEAHGYAILSADRGGVAVEMARQHHPDLILMDIQLPDISGLEATRQLKEDAATRSIPIVAVTAFAMAGDERRTLDAGCDAYIAKPIRLQEFLATVEKFTGGPIARL